MKTLDEVIDSITKQSGLEIRDVRKPDKDRFWVDRETYNDALHYLKTIETTENLYHDAVNELSKWKEEDWKDRCLPLTWDELRTMEGKPVWVEWQDQKEWFLIDSVDEKKVVFRSQSGFGWYCLRRENESWQAYRKERK